MVSFNYNFGCLVVKHSNELLVTLLNTELRNIRIDFRFLDLNEKTNKIFAKVPGNILIKDPETTILIFRVFSLGLIAPIRADIELRVFYNHLRQILTKYTKIFNNYSITRLNISHYMDACNRVAFEYLKNGKLIYQEGIITTMIQ